VESNLESMGRRIRETRNSQQISQETLADMAGVDRSHMGFIERGKKDIRVSTLLKIARALKMPPGNLLDFYR
jgi:transcriptional regulator with XRE-family HTH domain